jgi:hypothetical protein
MSQKYVTQGAMLKCNQGTIPGVLQVTSNFTVTSQNKFVATELDKIPFVNIPPFGVCLMLTKMSPVPCAPCPVMWTNTHPKTKAGVGKVLLKKSCIQCAIGGKISLTTPGQIKVSTGAKGGKSATIQILDTTQTVFDLAGLIPGVGEIFDGINASIYAIRGDYTNAALSAAAMIPFFGWGATATKFGVKSTRYTKSSLKLGRAIHKSYKLNLHNPAKGLFKEYSKIKGIRPDFVDVNKRIIYELKPNNPRGIKSGLKQLEKYKKKFEEAYGGVWETVLDLY